MSARCRRGNSWRSIAESVDELVLALARHQAAEAHHQLAVDAEAPAQLQRLVGGGRRRTRPR